MTVTPEQLQALLGRGCDPMTGAGLGRPYQRYATVAERIAARVAGIDRTLPAAEYDAEVARIEAEETAAGTADLGGRVRPDVLGAEVGLGAVGCGRCPHAGADRRGPPCGRRAGAGLLRARGRRHPRRLRGRRAGRRPRCRGGGVRPLGLARQRPAAAHPPGGVEQGPDRGRRRVAHAGLAGDPSRGRGALGVLQRRARRPPHRDVRGRVGAACPGRGSQPGVGDRRRPR